MDLQREICGTSRDMRALRLEKDIGYEEELPTFFNVG